jgi:capsular polysaccharide biosynthesis protein
VTTLQGASRGVLERAGAYGSVTAAKDPPAADAAAGLVSLKFIGATLRRRAWLWCAIAVAGLLTGLGIYVLFPPASQASTTILLTQIPSANSSPVTALKPPDAMQSAAVMVQSRTVAERTIHELGLPQSVDSFLAEETVTPVTARILTVTVSAPSSDEAVRWANALATQFLRFRAQQLQTEQNLWFTALNPHISQASERVARLASQIASTTAQPKSPEFRELQAELHQANNMLAGLQQTLLSYQAATTSAIQGSEVLDPAAPITRTPRALNSGKRLPIRYAVTGLIPGLALGLGLVIVLELASNRLRRREDIARALGAPVRLSIGSVPGGRRRPGRPGSAAVRGDDMRHIVAYLRDNVPGGSRGAAALAVVAVENGQAAALPLVSLAVSCAQEGQQVVVADLSAGAHAAHLLGAGDPGVHPVRLDGAHLVVAVPDRDDVAPVGPVRRLSPQAEPAPGGEALAAAYDSADLLLTLVSLDPLLGGEHLASWATDAVVVVTAGRSSARRLHAVGEMIRLARTLLASAALVGADKTDESLGTVRTPAPVNSGPFPAGTPAPARRRSKSSRPNTSRPGRGLHVGVRGKRT